MEGVVMLSPVVIFDFRSIRAIGIEHLACNFSAEGWRFDDRSYAIIGRVVRKTLGLIDFHIDIVDRLQTRDARSGNYTASVLLVERCRKRSYIRAPLDGAPEVGEKKYFGKIVIVLVDIAPRATEPAWDPSVGLAIIEQHFNATPVEYSVGHSLLVMDNGIPTKVPNVVWNDFLDTLLACNFPTIFERAANDAFALREKSLGHDAKYMLYRPGSQLSIRFMEMVGSSEQYTQPTIPCSALHTIVTRIVIDIIAVVDQGLNKGSNVVLSRVQLPIGGLW